MKKVLKPLSIILTIVVLVMALFSLLTNYMSTSLTEDVHYYYDSVSVDAQVDAKGDIHITETLTATFDHVQSRGIVRVLDTVATIYRQKGDKTVKYRHGIDLTGIEATSLFDSETAGGQIRLYLGEGNVNVANTTQTYVVKYKYSIGNDRNAEMDDFYFNFIGSSWNTHIRSLSFKVTFAQDIPSSEAYFYTGKVGGGDALGEDSGLTYTISDNVLSGSYSARIGYSEAFTVKLNLPEGFFAYESTTGIPTWALALVISLLVGATLLLTMKFSNRKTLITPVAFEPPKDLNPVDLKAIFAGSVNVNDIASMYIYWANKGYLTIKDEDGAIELTKVKDMTEGKSYEKKLFKALFSTADTVDLKKIQTQLTKPITDAVDRVNMTIKSRVDSRSISKMICLGLLTIIPTAVVMFEYASRMNAGVMQWMSMMWAILPSFAVAMITLGIYSFEKYSHTTQLKTLGICGLINLSVFCIAVSAQIDVTVDKYCIIILALVMSVVCLVFVTRVPRYTDESAKVVGEIIGFKNVLLTEKQRLNFMVKDDPAYFYDILPYAYVLGISDAYIEQFADLQIAAPAWAAGNVLSAYIYTRAITSGFTTLHNSIAISSSYSKVMSAANTFGGGSGGSGGGFSGGGFGGGGSGRW